MKKLFTLLVLFIQLQFINQLKAQCSGCLIDTTQTTVGFYPTTLPDATFNQPYNQDLTFVMFTDTLGFTVNTFQITGVSGAPVGINWQCNNSMNGCVYNPSTSIYGCVKICGTPLQTGTFNVVITIVADVQLIGQQSVDFTLPLTVVAASGGNAGFSFTPAAGCAPAAIDFSSALPAYDFNWDFGNGQTGSGANPPQQMYQAPGDYPVTLNATVGYQLQSITVDSIPDNYGGILDDPDMYFYLYDSSGTQVYDSHPSITNTLPPYTWSNLNLALTYQFYTFHLWDEDGGLGGADDDLGSVILNGSSLSGTLTSTLPGITGSLVMSYTSVPVIITFNDTIHVYAAPAAPVISSNANDTLCQGDSVALMITVPNGDLVQWYLDGNAIAGANDSIFNASANGNYTVKIIDTTGCDANSLAYAITVLPYPPKPNFINTGGTLTCFVTGYNLQWYMNGIVLPGATDSVYNATVPGYYTVIACNDFGCCSTSDSVYVTDAGINLLTGNFDFNLVPNPAVSYFNLYCFSKQNSLANLIIKDISGRVIIAQPINMMQGNNTQLINSSMLNAGIYVVELKTENGLVVKKLVVSK